MGTGAKFGILAVVLVVLMLLVGGLMAVSYSNREIRVRKQIETQQEACKLVYDETWKVIAQKAQVAEKYKDAFKEIFPALMEGRYGNARGGALMSFVKEANPSFDASLYKDLSAAIEGKRAAFTREQKRLLDLKRVHDTLLETFPSCLFVGSREPVEVQTVTSGKTKQTFETGEENDIDVFGGSK